MNIVYALAKYGLAASLGEARKLIANGAISVNEVKTDNPWYDLPEGEVYLSKGKTVKVLVTISKQEYEPEK